MSSLKSIKCVEILVWLKCYRFVSFARESMLLVILFTSTAVDTLGRCLFV